MADVFCSYRRQDTGDVVRQVAERLRRHFGHAAIFLDVEDEPYGSLFEKRVLRSIPQSRLMLAFIGEHWGDRINEPGDLVRREIEAALVYDVPIVPVLVKLDRLEPGLLPPHVAELAARNWARVDPARNFEESVQELIVRIEALLYELHMSLFPPEREALTYWGGDRALPTFFYHMLVENLTNTIVNDVQVRVTATRKVDPRGGDPGPTQRILYPLLWEEHKEERRTSDLGPQERKRCNLGRLRKDERMFALDIAGQWPPHEPHVLRSGRLQVQLEVTSDKSRPRTLVLEVAYDGSWDDSALEMTRQGHLAIEVLPIRGLDAQDTTIDAER